MRYYRIMLLICLLPILLALGSCDWMREPIKHAGEWKVKALDSAVVFYYVNEDLPVDPGEEILKQVAKRIAEEWREDYSNVSVYIFYDKKFAKDISEPKSMKQFVRGGLLLSKTVFSDGSLGTKGGGLYKLSDKKPDGEWVYVKKEG